MQASLNSFQRTMLLWDAFHPYNAVHVAKFGGKLELQRLTDAVNQSLSRLGVGLCQLSAGKSRITFQPGNPSLSIKVVPLKENLPETLREEMEYQVNTPFPTQAAFTPFRFFVVEQPGAYWLGLAYFHAIADASAIIDLLKQIGETYAGRENPASPAPLLKKPRSSWWRGLRSLAGFPKRSAIKSRCYAPALRDPSVGTNGLEVGSLPPEKWRSLRETAKSWGVTINDVFLAALLLATERLAVDRLTHGTRKNMAVCSIVGTREELPPAEKEAFGLSLGSFVVSHSVPNGITLEKLARDITTQTRTIKKNREYLSLTTDLAIARLALVFLPLDSKRKFYHKYNPSWGGVTNINLEALLARDAANPPTDYWRSVSTGPVTPFVFSVTTIASTLRIGFTYRTTIFQQPTARLVLRTFLQHLANPKGIPPKTP